MSGLSTYTLRRIAVSIPVLFLLLLFIFILLHLVPGDPLSAFLAEDPRATQEDVDRLRESMGLNEPLPVQFFNYMSNAVRGEFGTSLHSRESVSRMILDRLPYTLQLGFAALAFAVISATILGVLAAIFHNTWLDGLSMSLAILGVSIPNFWLGLMLISLFAVILNWLPASGAGTLGHLVLPTIALGTAWAALTTRLIRSSMLDVLGEDYVRTARSKGQVERKVITHHALRNALIPVVTYVGAQIPGIVGGAVVTETVFSRPGIGRLLIQSISRRDFAVVEGVILMIGVIVVVSNLLVDISYAFLDPQIRYG